MRMLIAISSLVVLLGVSWLDSTAAEDGEGISAISAESETVSAAPGKSVSVKGYCPAGTEVIGGGGECFGFLVTEGWVSLTKSAPVQGGSSWYVECSNTSARPGDIQARAWAICADTEIFDINKKK